MTTNIKATPKGDGIVVRFVYQNQIQQEILKLKPTTANFRYAERLLETINSDLRQGRFQYSKYFPESKQVQKNDLAVLDKFHHPAPIASTFAHVAYCWRQTLDQHSKGTRKHYNSALSKYWLPALGEKLIADIKYSELLELINQTPWHSAKHHNNCLVPLRRVFDLAFMDGLIEKNPMLRIKNRKLHREPPSPLSQEQIETILGYMRDHFHAQVVNYFQFAFYTGLRIEEQIALRWSDVDFQQETIHITKARTLGEEKGTKTGVNRLVDLNSVALHALHDQKRYSGEQGDFVFLNPCTDEPWHDNGKAQRLRYWNPTLKALGIPHRRAYETRHAYATMLLMSGCKHAYAAQQMGHSIPVFLNVYSRWIHQTELNQEKAKVSEFINQGVGGVKLG